MKPHIRFVREDKERYACTLALDGTSGKGGNPKAAYRDWCLMKIRTAGLGMPWLDTGQVVTIKRLELFDPDNN